MVPWRGRIKWKQYCPDKPVKFGFKVFVLCDAETNYIYNIDVYTGKKEVITKDLGGRTVLYLVSGLENKGHILYMDSFYSSVDLFRELEKRHFGCTGTIRKNRKKLPTGIKAQKLAQGEVFFFQSGNLSALKWKDKRDIYMLTNYDYGAGHELTNRRSNVIKKPHPVIQYNQYKGGVDVANQYASYYSNDHRSYKWWFRLFTGILDISVFNAFAINCEVDHEIKKKGFLEYRISVCKQIFTMNHDLPAYLPSSNRLALNHEQGRSGKQGRCRVCSTAKVPRTTIKICIPCQAALCSEQCWVLWHTKKSIKKRNKSMNLE